jgi:hypothetical protein
MVRFLKILFLARYKIEDWSLLAKLPHFQVKILGFSDSILALKIDVIPLIVLQLEIKIEERIKER